MLGARIDCVSLIGYIDNSKEFHQSIKKINKKKLRKSHVFYKKHDCKSTEIYQIEVVSVLNGISSLQRILEFSLAILLSLFCNYRVYTNESITFNSINYSKGLHFYGNIVLFAAIRIFCMENENFSSKQNNSLCLSWRWLLK